MGVVKNADSSPADDVLATAWASIKVAEVLAEVSQDPQSCRRDEYASALTLTGAERVHITPQDLLLELKRARDPAQLLIAMVR